MDPDWVPADVDTAVPNAARVYDYWLDGSHNFPADRGLGDQVQQILPQIRQAARTNRGFLNRAVRFMVESGIRQFLDLGSGIPTVGNVHQTAQRADPECRIVYVDQEPIAVAHSRMLLEGNAQAAVMQANLCDVDDVLNRPEVAAQLDFDQPVGLMLLLVLHFVPDAQDPVDVLARYRDRLAPGSYLAVSQVTADGDPAGMSAAVQLYEDTPTPLHPRSHEEVRRFFDGFELIPPGVVDCARWRPSAPEDPDHHAGSDTLAYAGVGRKP